MTKFAAVLCGLLSVEAFANASGAIGYSGAPGTQNCNTCHSGGGDPTVTITGPATLVAGATATYTITVSGGGGSRAGINVATNSTLATLNSVNGDTGVAFGELFQSSPKAYGGGSASFQFSLSAPPVAGPLIIYGSGNSVNGNGATSGDRSASTSLTVTVTAGSGMLPPAITTPASAMLSPLRARSTAVSVAAGDDGGEENLTYTWAATGPGPVVFTPNGSNAAKNAMAAFTREGMYAVTVTVRDGTNKTVTSNFTLEVESVLTALRMTPVAIQLSANANQQFKVSANDQFEVPISPQPTVTYSVPFGGTISATGLLKAQGSNGGPFIVQASGGSISTSSTFTVGVALPSSSDTTPPQVTLLAPATGVDLDDGLMLEATASDMFGIANVTFTVADVPVATIDTPPYRATYMRKAGLPPGFQNLLAVATDLNGNVSRSSSVLVIVPNTMSGAGGGSAGTGGGSATGGGTGTGGGGASDGGCSCDVTQTPMLVLAAMALRSLRRRRTEGR